MKASTVFIIASLLASVDTFADTLDVCLTGCRFNSVQAAIDSAANGDLIRVAQGTYHGTFVVRKNLSLQGGYFGPPTWQRDINLYVAILDGDSLGTVLTFSPNISPFVEGFTITGGNGSNGGGVAISGSSPTLNQNVIKGNRASTYGGGVWITGGSTIPKLDANQITENVALYGGGIAINSGSPALGQNVIKGNRASNSGGGLYILGGSISFKLEGNQIIENIALYGGGVAISGSSPTLSHNVISRNQANVYGGGIWLIERSAMPRIDANRIIENSASDGGGVFINDHSSPILTNNVIARNGATSNGDGIYIDFYSKPKIINNVIIDNNLPVVGRRTSPEGIFLYNFPSPTILNNIIAYHGNIVNRVAGFGLNADRVFVLDSISTIDFNDVWGNHTNYSDVPCGEHDISDDPRFVNPDSGDYHVQPNSIVIDKGTSKGAPATDIDGDLRPSGQGVDIGIDEDTMNIAKPPGIPSLVFPVNGSTEVPRYLTFKWNASIGLGAISYRLQISTDSCFSSTSTVPIILEQRGIADTIYSLGFNLSSNTKYYWRVDASNQLGTSSWSNRWSFTTTAVAGTPWLISPANGAINQAATLTSRWNYDFSATYRLQVSTDSNFTAPILDDSSITITSQQVGPLANNTTYCWRVQAKNIYGSGPWSSVWSFTTVCLRNGDVNNDSTLTSGDALCAFQIFLHGGTLPENCNAAKAECEIDAADANCDSSVTPGDALAIFQRFLQNLPPQECFARNALATNFAVKPYSLAWESQALFPEEAGKPQMFKLVLRVDDPQNLSAFGFNLSYPKEKLKFLGIKRGSLTSDWTQLDARESNTGVITLGGFHLTSIQSFEARELLVLLFAGSAQSLRAGDFAAANFSDDFKEVNGSHLAMSNLAHVPEKFGLFQNAPNPFNQDALSQETFIRFELPGSEAIKVDLTRFYVDLCGHSGFRWLTWWHEQ